MLGPVLVLPYTVQMVSIKASAPQATEVTRYLSLLPDTLATTGTLAPERRHRGIYETVVYRTGLHVQGAFQAPPLAELGVPAGAVHWNEAFIAVGIFDIKGIRNGLTLRWDNQSHGLEPGVASAEVLPYGTAPTITTQLNTVVNELRSSAKYQSNDNENGSNRSANGLSANIPIPDEAALTRRHTFTFEFDLDLNSSTGLLVAPLGRQTSLHLSAPWADPSFIGAFLPTRRTLGGQQFTADSQVLHLNRNFAQHWRSDGDRPSVNGSTFGVRLLVLVNEYQKTLRAAKYALLPLTLTFLIFFFVEVLNRRRFHPFQYILVGLVLVIFYILLLALSEQMPFNAAYGLSALVIMGLITAYAAGTFRHRHLTLVTTGVLTLVYSFLFVVLQLQDYALLVGSLGLVLVLGVVMFLSRNVNWYNPTPEPVEEPALT